MAHVVLSLPGQPARTLRHGDLIGRLPSAALFVDDPRVSEAHAMVSLRGQGFELLALRRTLAVDGRAVTQVALLDGLTVGLVPGMELTVEEVRLPASVPGLLDARGVVHVVHGVASVVAGSPPTVVGRHDADALASVWLVGDTLRARVAGGPTQSCRVGDVLSVSGGDVRVIDVPLHDATSSRTEAAPLVPRLHILAEYDRVRVLQDGQMPVELAGNGARILSELVALGGAAPWQVVAGEVWRDLSSRDVLRDRWDTALRRLRAQLREAGVREDLLGPDHGGNIHLRIHPWDEVVDRT